MKVVCAWCGVVVKQDDSDHPVSHGICRACAGTMSTPRDGLRLRDYLNRLSVPVVAVDSDGVVKVANDRALALFGKSVTETEGHRGGEVFECIHAKEPGGCGGTIHCSACTVRRTVMETFETGKPRIRVPAFLKHAATRGEEEISLYISTEKVGETVFLRIDRMGKKWNRRR